MKWLALLVACGGAPRVQTTISTQGLDASTVKSVELFVVQPDEGASLTCDALLGTRGVFTSGAVLVSSTLVTGTTNAAVSELAPGNYFAVAYAYDGADGVGQRVGAGCAQGTVTAGNVARLDIVLR